AVAEDVLGVALGRGVQDPRQVASHDLDLGDDPLAAEGVRRDLGQAAPVSVHIGEPALVDAVVADGRHDAHPLHDVLGHAPDVYRVAARSQGGGDLDDGRLEPVPVQPVGQGGSGDAGAGDEDGLGGHDALPWVVRSFAIRRTVAYTVHTIPRTPQ